MTSVITKIENIIIDTIISYNKIIADKYEDVTEEDLMTIWTELSLITEKTKATKSKSKQNGKEEEEEENTCCFLLVKGKRSGEECGCKTAKNSNYCSRHSKLVNEEKKPVEKKPTEKKTGAVKISKKDKVLKRNKTIDKLWHAKTKMVFKSATDRIVIGIFEDNKIRDLTEEDIETCKQWGFKYAEIDKSSNKSSNKASSSNIKSPKKRGKKKAEPSVEESPDETLDNAKNIIKKTLDIENILQEIREEPEDENKSEYAYSEISDES